MISSSPKQQLAFSTINLTGEDPDEPSKLNLYYTLSEVVVALVAVIGNAMVIAVFHKERKLRRRTNYYIVSLAAADFLVGLLGIPFAILAFVGLPRNLHACLFTVSLLVVLCTISIFCLVAVSVDRYWAILYPMGYSKHVRTKTTRVIISICWLAGCIIGFLPLMGWHQDVPEDTECFFLKVMDYNYLVFLYFTTIITPALLLAAFYAHIYRVVLKQLRTIVTMNPVSATKGLKRRRAIAGGTMLRVLGAAQKREVKATQNLSIIVLFFMICWIPLYTINFILAICRDCIETNSTLMLFCIILSHLNSAGNPVLYAYHLRDFRAALKNLLYALFGKVDYHSVILTTGFNCRPSLISNTPMDVNYSCKLSSWREMQNMPSLSSARHKRYTEVNSEFDEGNTFPERPGISTIVTGTTALAVAPATAGDSGRKMWRISEIPSCSEIGHSHENSINNSSSESRSNNVAGPHRLRTTSSGKINSGYLAEFICEEGDDDVFMDNYSENDSGPINDTCRAGSVEFLTTTNNVVINSVPKSTNIIENKKSCSSPQLSRNLFIVEDEIKNNNVDNSVQTFPSIKNGLKHSQSGSCLSVPKKNHNFNLLKTLSKKFISAERTQYSGSKGPP